MICEFYLTAWYELVTERPVIATMASVDFGIIPRSKIKAYAEDEGLVGDEVDLFISIMRRVETRSRTPAAIDPDMTDQATDADGVKKIIKRLAKPDEKSLQGKKPKVRHPR